MDFDKNIVDRIINTLPPILGETPFGLLVDEEEGPQKPICFDEIQEQILDIDGNIEFRYGMSKLVIIAPSLKNIVIKIPFSGIYDKYYGDYDKHKDIIYFDEDLYEYGFTPFNYARSKDKTNYCAVELEKYKRLKKIKLDNFVAETEFYKTLSNGIKIYIQERAYSSEDDPNWEERKSTQKSKNIVRRWSEDEEIAINTEWVGLCIDKYGEVQTKAFLDYCNYKDPIIISDCHIGNIGYRVDGTPLLIDFSGFEE